MAGALTLVALAVVQPVRVDAVRPGRRVPQVDQHRVALLGLQQGSQVAQPLRLGHFCPVGGVAVLLVHSLLVGGADALGSSLQKDCSVSAGTEGGGECDVGTVPGRGRRNESR